MEDNEDGSGDGDGIGGLPAEGFELDPSDTPPDLRLDPTKLQQLKVQMDAIHVVMRTTAGQKTYRTSWKKYDAWHLASFGVQGPRCQFSGLLFMSRTMATVGGDPTGSLLCLLCDGRSHLESFCPC